MRETFLQKITQGFLEKQNLPNRSADGRLGNRRRRRIWNAFRGIWSALYII